MRPFVVLSLFYLSCCTSPPKERAALGESAPVTPTFSVHKTALDEALHWLPEDTETLIVAQEPFILESLPDEHEDKDNDEVEAKVAERFRPWSYLSFGFIRDGELLRKKGGW